MVELHGANYGDAVPWEQIREADTVYISDFSYSMEDMAKIDEMCDLIWYDHHISAINAAKEAKLEAIFGLRDVDKSGCMLTWLGLFPDEVMPLTVMQLGKYDCWSWIHEVKPMQEEILDLQASMQLEPWEPTDERWSDLFCYDLRLYNSIIVNGSTVRKYIKQHMSRVHKNCSVIQWHGVQTLIANSHASSTLDYEDKAKEVGAEIVLSFYKSLDGWKYSLRSFGSVDVSELADRYGGGGHKAAAGFYLEYLLEELM